MKYKAILFDADGVSIKEGKMFSDVMHEKYGTPIEVMQPFFKGIFQECMVGKADVKEELVKVLPDWKWEGTVDELMDFWFSTGDDLSPQVVELIMSLKERGVRCVMTTNQEKYRGEYLRQKLVPSLFERVFVSADIGAKKNEPTYFQHVLNELKLEKSEVLFIDDDEENVETAKEMGIEAIYYQSFGDIEHLVA